MTRHKQTILLITVAIVCATAEGVLFGHWPSYIIGLIAGACIARATA